MIKKYYDQHTHSSFSPDSHEDLRSYFLRAREEGVEYVCTCEHYDIDCVPSGTTWEADYPKLIEYQKKLHKEFPDITPLLGIEVGYKKSQLAKIYDKVSKYDFDIIQLSIHDNEVYDYYFEDAFQEPYQSMQGYFDLMIYALNNYDNYDILSHIDFGFKTLKLMDKNAKFSDYEDRIIEALSILIKKNKTLEINSKVQIAIEEVDGNNDHLLYLLKLYKSLGGEKLSLSSDAHTVSKYRINFEKYMKIIKDSEFDYLCYYIKRKEYKYYL